MAELAPCPCFEAARLLVADVHGDVGEAELQGLEVVLTAMNSTPGYPRLDHAVDGVDAGAADPDDTDHRLVGLCRFHAALGSGSSRP